MITWTTYLTACGMLTGIYYAVVSRRPAGKLKTQVAADPANNTLRKRPAATEETTKATMDAAGIAPVHAIVDELVAFVMQAGKEQMNKDQLHASLREVIQKYPGFQGTLFQEGITDLIAAAVETHCAIQFSEEELSDLWTG